MFGAEARTPPLEDSSALVETIEPTAVQSRSLWNRARSFVREMRECRRQQPPTDRNSQRIRYQLSQLGIDQAMTVTGAIVASGIEHVEWRNLPSDLVMESIFSLAGSCVITAASDRVIVRWMRVQGFGFAANTADAMIYWISPVKDTHGESEEEATWRRFRYNVSFNVSWTPISVNLYELFSGLECMYPSGRFATALGGVRLAQSLGVNVVYFRLRQQTNASHR